MTYQIAEAAAKLRLDEETREMVSKNELKKRTQKRAKKAAAAARPKETGAGENAPKFNSTEIQESGVDPDWIFRQGWLTDVYKERAEREVLTRFPPEPNGYLHLGHAKAIAVNFGFARFHNGKTILRFDDTNPGKEEQKYFVAIEETIKWLGFGPSSVTYTSDNFQKLYDLAEKLIGLGKAYVCHCNQAETTKQRGGKDGKEGPRYRCKHAEQTTDANLQKFRDMRDGVFRHKEAILRMRQDIENPNPQMWDLAAYRIPDKTQHFRTGDKWKIFPTYDFAHCLCDSFEAITHSLCTTEFVLSRESYEWLNRSLGVYEPMQREYGRLNIDGAIMSKRGIHDLVENQYVKGWDDPRLFTLAGLRRRGVPPAAILVFINELGVTTSNTTIQIARFEQSARRFLETSVPRVMLVLDPVPLVIEGFEELVVTEVEAPFSKDPTMGSHMVRLTRTVYVDRSDFREVADDNFFRLAPGKKGGSPSIPGTCHSDYIHQGRCGSGVRDTRIAGERCRKTQDIYPVGSDGSKTVEARVHGRLFNSDDPKAAPGGFLEDINPKARPYIILR